MSSPPELKLDWCSHKAAKYAVMNWHYSKAMPAGKIVKIGVWEDGVFIGSVLFSRGSNIHIGKPYQLTQIEVCELTRVALTDHKTPVSKVVSIAIKMLKNQSPGLRLIVSYADPEQGHAGTIYQAMNWVYTGESQIQVSHIIVGGKAIHKRSAVSKFGTANPDKIKAVSGLNATLEEPTHKLKYLYPLDKEMRKQIDPLSKPYPKHAPEA